MTFERVDLSDDVTLYRGDCLEVLPTLPEASVHCVVTSPPYYGLRDYGVDGQIGLEQTPDEYVANIVAVMREVWRVLRDDGTVWLNLGDSYASSGKPGFGIAPTPEGLKPKDLIGIPWRVALALQQDGWYLRSDIIWHKPNPMPESVTDRPTKAHEYVFLLTKSARYWYDAEAIAEPLKVESIIRNQTGWHGNELRDYISGPQNHMSKYLGSDNAKAATTRNRRSVWTVATHPYSGAHFATFPPALITPMILAGCPAQVCPVCGKGWERVMERTPIGFRPTCDCGAPDSVPGVVLDPFGGSGTTAEVAVKHGRQAILIDLNAEYVELQKARLFDIIAQPPLFRLTPHTAGTDEARQLALEEH